MNANKTLYLGVLGCLLIACAPARGALLFFENFEAYAAGSSLSGQNGWAGDTMYIGDSTHLGSRALDAFQSAPLGPLSVNTASKNLARALDPSEVTTLLFNAYAASGSQNSGIYLGAASQAMGLGWMIGNNLEWAFDARVTGAGNYLSLSPGGMDANVSLGVVVDGPNGQVYGIYDFGSGQQTTAAFAITPSQITDYLGFVTAMTDYRDFGGPLPRNASQFDDLTVTTAVPEPATVVLTGIFLVALLGARRIAAR